MATKRRTTRTAYRCSQCKTRKNGSPGMVACPECGGELVQLYAPRRPHPNSGARDG